MRIRTQNLLSALFFLTTATFLQLLFPLLQPALPRRLPLWYGAKTLLRSALILSAYMLLNACLHYLHSPTLTPEEKAALPAPETFYGSSLSAQRAAWITDNRQALELRLRMIREAETSVILTTFSFRADNSGNALCAALLDAADRGVQVGILTDGYDAMTNNDGKLPFTALAAHPNIDFHIYAPGSILRPAKAMARMHEKYLICDSGKLLLGGRNCHDYFLGSYPAKLHNLDLDVLICGGGDVIDQLTARYCEIVRHNDTVPLRPESDPAALQDALTELRTLAALLPSLYPAAYDDDYDYDAHTLPCRKISLLSSDFAPAPKKPTLWHMLCRLMEAARTEVRIHTPYLICNSAMKADLARIARAVPLQITLNSPRTSANLFGAAVYYNDREALLQTGADIREYHGRHSLHAKAISIDDRLSIIGSFNFDMRSTYINSELMLAIDSPELAHGLNGFMDSVAQNSQPAAEVSARGPATIRSFLISVLRLIERPFRHLL